MDYDDNNFQSQNFQPVGDENKFPPSLRSFALPKFDLDEHLQVHLRFDGLVNTDVLLGIRNQDNNWIEDFSSGTSAIEFSSSAADNCSISRHNNVWSEATSSESVELLLKSVGEDEMNGRKSTRMEDAQNLLSGMINRVDPALRQVDNDNYRMVDIIQEDPSLPPDKFQRNLLGQDKEGSGFQSLAHGMPEISRAELDASSVGDEIQSDRKIGAGQCISDETATLQFDSTNNTCLVTSETSCKTVNNDKPSATDFMKGSDGCWDTIKVARGSLDPITQTGNQEQVVDDEQTLVNMAERSDLLSNDPKDRSQISRHAERSEHFMEGHGVDTHLCTAVCSSSLEHTKDSLMLGSEGCNMSSFSGHPDGLPEAIAYEVKALKNDNKADNNNAMQEHEMNTPEIKSEKFVQTHYLDISKGNICSQLTGPNEEGTSSNSEVEVNASIHMNSETQLKEKEVGKRSDNSLCQGSHTLEGTFEEKNVEAEAVKEVEESGSELIDSENIMSDILPKVAEPSASSLEVSDGSEDVGPSISHATTDLNNDNAAKWEVGSARSAGQNSVDGGVTLNSPAKKVAHDGSVGDLTSMGVGLPSIKTYTSDDVSHPSGSLARDGAREKTEATSPKSIELESVCCDVKEVKTSGISSVSGLNSSLDAQFPIESVIVADPIAPACSSPSEVDQDVQVGDKVAVLEEAIKCHQSQDSSAADVVREQQEMTMSSQFSSEFVPPDEIEAKISGNSNLIKSKGYIDDRQLAESDAENYHLSSTTKPQTVRMELHSTYVENYVTSQGELQPSVHKPVTQEEAILVEGNLVIHCSPVKKKDNSYTPEASFHEKDDTILIISADLPRHVVGRMLPEPSPSVERTSASPVDSGMSTSTMLTRSNTEEHLSAVETPKASLLEPSCGLPTVMSSVHYHDEPEGGNNDNIKQTTLGSKDGTASEDDISFTFEVGRVKELSVKDPGQWNPFASLMSSSKLPKITEGSSWGCHSEPGRKHGVITKPDSEDKPHGTRCSNEKLTTLRSQPAEETSTLKKSTDSVGKSCTTSSAPIGTVNSGMQLEEIKANTCAESNPTKSSGSTVIQSSSLPDLNSSSTTLFLQPFTDIQQVQLRAQIFVYGSLIQSIPPDEACMQSAFGETDGGRSSWESVWHKSVDRYQNQKPPINPETPLISHSVARVTEQFTMSISVQSKTTNSSAGRSVGKVISPDTVNATPPLQSPLWSISMHDGLHSNLPRGTQLDFNQALSPLHSYPSSQSRQFTSTTSPWLPQNPCPGSWAVSTQSPAINAATQYSTVPVNETVQVTPFIEASMPHPTSVQRASPSPLLLASSPASVPWTSIVHLETQKKTSSHVNKNTSASQKSRKKKRAAVSEDFAETIPVSQSPAEAASVSALTETLSSASPGMPSSANMPLKVASEPFVSTMIHLSPKKYQIIGSDNTEQRVIFSEETCNKIEQAKLQAETAAALAASVVSHSQHIWNQLAAHMNSGLVTEVEEKLSSAAVAAAAAASVAKVAAAAAKIASDAALQAKMMADEALDSAKTGTVTQISDAVFDAGKNLTRLTPGSILKGKDKIHGSSSSISAACEAARRKVEAASAATKRAENLDAIMKVAELAAEAVSQVGTIIAMGDPLPLKLKELVEAGPDASWKTYRSTSEKLNKANNEALKDLDHSGLHYDEIPVKNKEMQKITIKDGIVHDEKSIQCGDNGQGLGTEVGNPSTLTNDSHEMDHSWSNLKEDVIQKGTIVEVLSDEDGLRGGWFSARVLDVKDNKAHICYNNLHSDDGSGQLKEWISLDCEINGAPRIRIAHPLIGMKHAGTRKRRREAYAWDVGDRVDAWMRDGWWEGIVTGNSQEDETKLTVNFPAGGGTSPVRSWDLRPSLIWKDGQWIEWSRPRENVLIQYEGDAPQEKRQKLCGNEGKIDVEVGGVSKPSKKMPPDDSVKAGALGPLNLSANDKKIPGGKNAREANLSDALKVKRTGLQKEGSRVVFGVPKPGKKKKFMEVSKHFVTDKTETSQGNDSNIAKFLMPQASRTWRNMSKIDPKGKPHGDSKFPGVKSVKSQTSHNKNISQKDSLLVTATSSPNMEKNGHVCLSNVRTAISNEENNSEKKSLEVVSFPSRLRTTESLVDVSSAESLPTIPASKKKNSSTVEAEQGVKGRVTPALDKSTRSIKKPSENTGKSIPDTIEPRRSNRRIQPTSRLLEGLQSSLIISKIPALSHDKGSKASHRSTHSKGNARGQS